MDARKEPEAVPVPPVTSDLPQEVQRPESVRSAASSDTCIEPQVTSIGTFYTCKPLWGMVEPFLQPNGRPFSPRPWKNSASKARTQSMPLFPL